MARLEYRQSVPALMMHAHAREANDAYVLAKDAHISYAIFQSRKSRKFLKNKRYTIFEFYELEHFLKNIFISSEVLRICLSVG